MAFVDDWDVPDEKYINEEIRKINKIQKDIKDKNRPSFWEAFYRIKVEPKTGPGFAGLDPKILDKIRDGCMKLCDNERSGFSDSRGREGKEKRVGAGVE